MGRCHDLPSEEGEEGVVEDDGCLLGQCEGREREGPGVASLVNVSHGNGSVSQCQCACGCGELTVRPGERLPCCKTVVGCFRRDARLDAIG